MKGVCRMQFFQCLLLVASLLLFLFIAVYSLLHPSTPGSRALFMLMFAAIIWSVGSFFELYAPDFEGKLLWRNIQQVGVFIMPITTLYFSAAYTMQTRFRKYIHAVAVFPLISILLIFTNELHHIIRSGYAMVEDPALGYNLVVHLTPVGQLLVALNLTLPFVAVGMLYCFQRKITAGFKKQVWLMIGSFLYTFAISLIRTTILDPMRIYVFISAFYIPSALILFYSLFKYDFFSLTPIAWDKVFEVTAQGILILDKKGRVADVNSHAKKMLEPIIPAKYPLIGCSIAELLQPFTGIQRFPQPEASTVEIQISTDGPVAYYSLEQHPLHNYNGNMVGAVLILHNITRQKLHEFQLKEQADQDGLTRLLNRNGFMGAYADMHPVFYSMSRPVSVLMIDLDFFKPINDRYGHMNGDKILCHFANLLRAALREEDIIGRLGGDEFSVVLPNTPKASALKIAERITDYVALSTVTLDDGQVLKYTVSIGIAENSLPEKDICQILAEADIALYKAKKHAGNCTMLYEESFPPPALAEAKSLSRDEDAIVSDSSI